MHDLASLEFGTSRASASSPLRNENSDVFTTETEQCNIDVVSSNVDEIETRIAMPNCWED